MIMMMMIYNDADDDDDDADIWYLSTAFNANVS